jgi:translocation and assembly module TamA
VRVTRQSPVIDHRDQTVDLTLAITPGPIATLGPVMVTGARAVDPAVIRSFIYTEPGDPYSPQAITATRRSVSRIEALGAVRVREGAALDGAGRLPLTVEVTERPPRLIGGSARYSTTDGPALRAYWAHRNLFGGAERLRLDADLFYTVLDRDGRSRRFEGKDLGGRLSASFLKPALGGSRFDLLADAAIGRERTEAYDADTGLVMLAIRRRFTDSFSVQGGLEGEAGRITPAPGPDLTRRFDYGLVGLPLSVIYDDTDRPLDATRGIKITGSVAPYLGFGDAARIFGIGRVQASTYYALDAEARMVLAARIGFGSIVGGEIGEIPSTRLFFAGGGGSVRGFDYKSLSPRGPTGRLTGGRSLVEGSLEARMKITETIGVVPFIDVGQAYAGAFPDGSEKLRIGVGLGLRYYTGLGPIRVDVATPLGRRKGESPYAVYVSIGQAF